MTTTRRIAIYTIALLLAMLIGMLTTASADGPWLWQEKCPTQHYEVRIDQAQRGVVVVSCVRMAREQFTGGD